MANSDILKEYLVALGFQIDRNEFAQFEDVLRQTAAQASSAASGTTAAWIKASGAILGSLAAVEGSLVGLMRHTAMADLNYQVFARRMFMSTDAARELKIATDELGYSLEDIIWGPKELKERFAELIDVQKQMTAEMGGTGGFERQMRYLRDINFEFTKFRVEMQWFGMFLARDLSKALFGDETKLLEKLREWNKWFVENMPRLSEFLAQRLAPVMRDIYAIFKDIGSVLKDIASGTLEFLGWLYDDQRLKGGKVNIENITIALEHLVHSLRNIADTAKEIWSSPVGRAIFGAAIGGAVAGPYGAVAGGAIGLGSALISPEAMNRQREMMGGDRKFLEEVVGRVAQHEGVDPAMLKAIIDRESAWNPNALNPQSGAFGMMQLMPEHMRDYGMEGSTLMGNLTIGARLYKQYLEQSHGDVREALRRYGGFVTKDPSAYQDYILKHSEQYRKSGVTGSFQPSSYTIHNDIGGVTVHVTQPHATPEQIAAAVSEGIERKMGRQTQRHLAQFQEVYA